MEFREDPSSEDETFQKVEPPAPRSYAPLAEPIPAAVDTLARERFPEILQKAKDFCARHPTLVTVAGTVAAAAIARRLFRGRPGLF